MILSTTIVSMSGWSSISIMLFSKPSIASIVSYILSVAATKNRFYSVRIVGSMICFKHYFSHI